MKPIDALDIQRDYKNKCQDANFRIVLDAMIMSASGIAYNKKDKQLKPESVVGAYLSSAIGVGIGNTPCYFVKDEMTDLIMFASQKLDDTDLFDTTLIPSDKGFVYFEKPLEIQDVRGRKLLGNVVVWEKGFYEGKHGIIASLYNDAHSTPDDISRILLENKKNDKPKKNEINSLDVIGRFHWLHSLNAVHGDVIGEKAKAPDEQNIDELRSLIFNEQGELVSLDDEAWEEYKKTRITPFTNIKRLIHTYFLIMSQTITATTSESGDRAQRRRLERENLPSEVLVIQFRKTRYTSAERGEEASVNWSHRWIVGGHWRWQPYKDPVSGGEIKKRIWISPYVKGPDDKPLKTKERVYVLAK